MYKKTYKIICFIVAIVVCVIVSIIFIRGNKQEKILLVSEIQNYDENGSIQSRQNISYTEKGFLEAEELIDYSEGTNKVSHIKYQYDNRNREFLGETINNSYGKESKVVRFDDDFNITEIVLSKEKMEDKQFMTEQDIVYDDEQKLNYYEYSCDFLANEGEFKVNINYQKEENIQGSNKIVGKVWGESFENSVYNEANVLIEYLLDDSGDYLKETWYESNDSEEILFYAEYLYDNEQNLTETVFYNSDGSVASRKEYTYDDKGNRLSCTEYDTYGAVIKSTKYIYAEYEIDISNLGLGILYKNFFVEENDNTFISYMNESNYFIEDVMAR